jgi:hypothetical protein
MGTGIVDLLEFFNSNFTVTIQIKLGITTLNQVLSERSHFTNNNSEKFIEVDFTASISIHRLEKALNIDVFDVNIEIMDGLGKFIDAQLAIAVVVKDFKLSLKTDDASASTVSQCLSESSDEDALELWNDLWTFDTHE